MAKKITLNIPALSFTMLFGFAGQLFADSPYQLKTQNELAYLAAGTSLSLAGYYLERNRTAPTKSSLASLNKNMIWRYEQKYAGRWNEKSRQLSDITLATGILSPLALLLMKNSNRNDYLTIGTMYLETFALSNGGVVFSKGATTRYRPFAYGEKASLAERTRLDTKRSFFSGHAALSASGFIFSATVFSDYFPRSKYKTPVWVAAIAGTTATGLLRVKAGKHFPTDVLAGWAWGGTIGYLVPALHRKSNKHHFTFLPFTTANQQGIFFSKAL